jgi:hypothetical protein
VLFGFDLSTLNLINRQVSLKVRVSWVHLNSNDALANNCGNLDVALFTPAGVPWVLNVVVLLTTLDTVSCCQYCVVQISTTINVVKDTTTVESHSKTGCIDRDSNGVKCDCLLKGGYWVRGNWSETSHSYLFKSLSWTVLAVSVCRFVGVCLFRHRVFAYIVSEPTFLRAAIAAKTCRDTINKLLLGQADELPWCNLVSTL